MQNLKIGILGTGDVGRALGDGFISLGCQVKMGAREANSEKAREWAAATAAGELATTGTFAEAAQFGDILVLATLWSGTENALRLAGPDHFAGKIVLDTTNPLKFAPDALPTLAIGHTDSGGEQVQRWLPAARVVKAFNSVGHAHMVNPQFPEGPPDMFIAGDDAEAKARAADICRAFGWDVIDMGGIDASRLLEPLCLLWVYYGIRGGGWNHAFRLLRK